MYQDKIEYLKRAIKRNYKRYIGERTDGKATLVDVLKLFNIFIDENRTDDYIIESIDYNWPSIKIVDTKTNTVYTSKYTSDANLLNYSGYKTFINVIIENSNCKLENLYYIDSDKSIISQMTFTDGDYELIFEKEMGNSIGFGLNAKSKFVIRYVKNIREPDRCGKQRLLSKIFLAKNDDETFEQTYTYSLQRLIKYGDNQDKYCYIKNGNVIYGVNNCDIKDLIHYLHGICFESTDVNVSEYLPYNINTKKFPELANNEIYQSGIVFKGGTDKGIHHVLTVFKTKSQDNNRNEFEKNGLDYNIHLKYEAIKLENFKDDEGLPDCREIVVASKDDWYKGNTNGNITSLEIQNIIERLNTEFSDNVFIQFVIKELRAFANKMDIQKGIGEEEIEPLSPKIFINKTFDEIYALVSRNKDDYFNLISDQFEALTNTKGNNNSDRIRRLARK